MAPYAKPESTGRKKNHGGRAGSSSSGNKRTTSKKKKCPHGSDCKYQHEYQHQLEFHHNETEKELAAKQNTFQAFSGRGQMVASSSSSSSSSSRTASTSDDIRSKPFETFGNKKTVVAESSRPLSRESANTTLPNRAIFNKGRSNKDYKTQSITKESSRNIGIGNQLESRQEKSHGAAVGVARNTHIRPDASTATVSHHKVVRIPSEKYPETGHKRKRQRTDVQVHDGHDSFLSTNKIVGKPNNDIIILDNSDDIIGSSSSTTAQSNSIGTTNQNNLKRKGNGEDCGSGALVASGTVEEEAIDLCDSDDEVLIEKSQIQTEKHRGTNTNKHNRSNNAKSTSKNDDNLIDITDSPPTSIHNLPSVATAHQTEQNDYGSNAYTDNESPFIPGLTSEQLQHMQQQQFRLEKMLQLERLKREEERQLAHAVAQSNRAVTNEQDAAYYESLRLDQEKELQRKRDEEEKRVAEETDKERKAHEERVIAEKARQEEEDRLKLLQHATTVLEDEPPANDTTAVTVAFKLPRQCNPSRLIRRFRSSSTAEQLHFYLNSRASDQLKDVSRWKLCQVVGHEEIVPSCRKSMRELGLLPRGLLVVEEIENNEETV